MELTGIMSSWYFDVWKLVIRMRWTWIIEIQWKRKMEGYVCSCFYERNIYLKSLDLHVTYTGNEADFRSSYGEVISIL